MEHEFTKKIKDVLRENCGEFSDKIFSESLILQYLNIKTKSASKGSKSRGSFANLCTYSNFLDSKLWSYLEISTVQDFVMILQR